MTPPRSALLLACASLLGSGFQTLEAQDIFNLNFDTASGNYQFGYAFAGYGDPTAGNVDVSNGTSQVTEIAIGAGISGTNGLRITMDATAAGAQLPANRTYDYLGFAVAANTGFIQPLSSGQLADYNLSLSARADGFLPNVTSSTGELFLSISAPDGTTGNTDGNADLLIGLRFPTGVQLASAFQQSTMNLGTGTVAEGSLANFTNFFSTANQVTFIITPNEANGRFGFDAGNVVVVDDASLAVVPEPASALYFVIGAPLLAGAMRRRAVRR